MAHNHCFFSEINGKQPNCRAFCSVSPPNQATSARAYSPTRRLALKDLMTDRGQGYDTTYLRIYQEDVIPYSGMRSRREIVAFTLEKARSRAWTYPRGRTPEGTATCTGDLATCAEETTCRGLQTDIMITGSRDYLEARTLTNEEEQRPRRRRYAGQLQDEAEQRHEDPRRSEDERGY